MALLDYGTRTLLDVVFGPTKTGETTYTPTLSRSMGPNVIVLADRNVAAQHLLAGIHQTGAHFLLRLKNERKLPMLERYPDGSYLSLLGPTEVHRHELPEMLTATLLERILPHSAQNGRNTRGP